MKTTKGKISHDKGGRPYRVINGTKVYLSWEERYVHMRKKCTRLEDDLHRAGIGNALLEQRVSWKEDEIEKLKRELALYQVGYLEEKEPLQDAVLKIGRVINNRDRYTKKQMMDRIEEILLSLGTLVPEEETNTL